jgi:hypothetical protein
LVCGQLLGMRESSDRRQASEWGQHSCKRMHRAADPASFVPMLKYLYTGALEVARHMLPDVLQFCRQSGLQPLAARLEEEAGVAALEDVQWLCVRPSPLETEFPTRTRAPPRLILMFAAVHADLLDAARAGFPASVRAAFGLPPLLSAPPYLYDVKVTP